MARSSSFRPLSVGRIREVLAAWPPPVGRQVAGELPAEPDPRVVADYHRIVAIHHSASEGGARVVRDAMAAQLRAEPPAEAVAEALPAGASFGNRRIAAALAASEEAARDAIARMDSVAPDEEAAVRACRPEIEAALARCR